MDGTRQRMANHQHGIDARDRRSRGGNLLGEAAIQRNAGSRVGAAGIDAQLVAELDGLVAGAQVRNQVRAVCARRSAGARPSTNRRRGNGDTRDTRAPRITNMTADRRPADGGGRRCAPGSLRREGRCSGRVAAGHHGSGECQSKPQPQRTLHGTSLPCVVDRATTLQGTSE